MILSGGEEHIICEVDYCCLLLTASDTSSGMAGRPNRLVGSSGGYSSQGGAPLINVCDPYGGQLGGGGRHYDPAGSGGGYETGYASAFGYAEVARSSDNFFQHDQQDTPYQDYVGGASHYNSASAPHSPVHSYPNGPAHLALNGYNQTPLTHGSSHEVLGGGGGQVTRTFLFWLISYL